MAFDSDVLEPVGGVSGLEDVSLPPGGGDAVDLADVEGAAVHEVRSVQVVLGHVAGGVQRLAVGERERGSLRAEVARGGSSR